VNNFRRLLVSCLLASASLNVMALPLLTGKLDMGGAAYLEVSPGVRTMDASAATAIDFDPNNFRVLHAEDDFLGELFAIGSIQDLAFDPFAGPVANFWTVGGFSFELTNVVRGTTNDPLNVLVLNGAGTISAAGFADTAATWNFSANTTGNGLFSWQATDMTKPNALPEPGVLALLSLGLIGVGMGRRKNKELVL
jgi:hypothetical protein